MMEEQVQTKDQNGRLAILVLVLISILIDGRCDVGYQSRGPWDWTFTVVQTGTAVRLRERGEETEAEEE